MQQDIQRVLIDRQTIARRVEEIAGRIVRDLEQSGDVRVVREGNGAALELTLVPILTGSIIFVADRIRRMPLRMQIRLISVSSYPGAATVSRSAVVQASLTSLSASLEGQHVLLIDDILDSGKTLRAVRDIVAGKKPASLRTCVLLRKLRPEAMAFGVDYVCFDIPDEFVVGYGLDFNDYYRNLPEIVTLKPEVIRASQAAEC